MYNKKTVLEYLSPCLTADLILLPFIKKICFVSKEKILLHFFNLEVAETLRHCQKRQLKRHLRYLMLLNIQLKDFFEQT